MISTFIVDEFGDVSPNSRLCHGSRAGSRGFCENECRTWFNSKVAWVATAICSPDMQSSGLSDAYPALTVHSASSGYVVISAMPVTIINFHSTAS